MDTAERLLFAGGALMEITSILAGVGWLAYWLLHAAVLYIFYQKARQFRKKNG